MFASGWARVSEGTPFQARCLFLFVYGNDHTKKSVGKIFPESNLSKDKQNG